MIHCDEHIPITRLCTVLNLSRSQFYRKVKQMRDYRVRGQARQTLCPFAERAEGLARQYTFYGHRKIHALLRREGYAVSRYQVYTFLQDKHLCLPSTWRKDLREHSRARKQYLTRPDKPLELLQADFTHVPVEDYGMYYVCDIIDYFSKYTLVTLFSDRHDAQTLINACNDALTEAQRLGLELPEKIKLLTDNGPAMISQRFARYIKQSPFVHLRTGNHHPETNGSIERFHQTLKYEEVWGAMYENPLVAKERIEKFRTFYNTERIHQTLNYKTPLEVIEEYKQLSQINYLCVA
jgi:transposase InsO family protein